MNQRQQKKTLRRFCQIYALKEERFAHVKAKRRAVMVAKLCRELDAMMDYYYGRYCR